MKAASFALVLLFCTVFGRSAPSFADSCEDRAAAVYQDAVRQCRADSGGGRSSQCRFDRDCSAGQTCDDGRCVNDPVSCVPRCNARDGSGNCNSYSADYCATGNPSCTAYCVHRDGSGHCNSYGPDVCSAYQVSCTANCTARNGSGACYEYGADVCN